MTDAKTLSVYAERARDYATKFTFEPGEHMRLFEASLPRGATVLDLGCGPGRAAGFFASHGHKAHAWDPVAEMVAMADAQPGVTARQAGFENLHEAPALDGLWASFSLLHAPKADFPRYLASATSKVRPGGLTYLGMKTGTGEGPDSVGRFYAYYSEDDLIAALATCGVEVFWQKSGEEAGLSGDISPFVLLLGRKHA